jgi:hypothetical protein
VLGRIDQVRGNAEHLGEYVGRAAGQEAQRRGRARQAVGGFVDRAVAPERDDDVVALTRRRARELGGVSLGLGVDRPDLEAVLEREHDHFAQRTSDRRRVGVDDQKHAPLPRRRP